MPLKPYNQNPKTSDNILFDLYTPMSNGCFTQQPSTFDSIKIFFIARSPVLNNEFENQQINYKQDLQRAVYEVTEEYCTETDELRKQRLAILQQSLEADLATNALTPTTGTNVEPGANTNTTYYYEAQMVFCAGVACDSGAGPLWIQGEDNSTSIVQRVDTDKELGNGHFAFIWEPGPIKEGDYYICYGYTMQTSAYLFKSEAKFIHFYIGAAIQNEVAIPTHAVPPEKYFTLLNAYLPRMYFEKYGVNDDSMFTLEALNQSVGQAFTDLDNQVSRIIDILDANVTPEPYLPLLAQMFALKLRSLDITRWRGQIVTAVPQFKKKGTLESLTQALDQAGMQLLQYKQYWQIAWPQVYTQTLKFENDYEFILDKYTDNTLFYEFASLYELQLAHVGTTVWTSTNIAAISFSQNTKGETVLTWDPTITQLKDGDQILITYVTETMTGTQVDLYQYWKDFFVRQDIRVQNPDGYFLITPDMQPANWNMRLMPKDDPLFSVFIPIMNPFYDPVVFGMLRTDFPYSENVYNMEEYNGSLRPTTDPTNMAADYLEGCSGTLSADYGLAVKIQNLSDFRISECLGIIRDYTPYHAILRTLEVVGQIQDFMLPPVETIEWLIQITFNDFLIAGDAQYAFNRKSILYNYTDEVYPYTDGHGKLAFYRTDFATENTTPAAQGTLTVYNKSMVLQAQSNIRNLNSYNVTKNSCYLEILDGNYAGAYTNIIESVNDFTLTIEGPAAAAFAGMAPITQNYTFGWRFSNILDNGPYTISNAYQFTISDSSINYSDYNIKTVALDGTGCYQVKIGTAYYNILLINNNSLYLENQSGSPLPVTDSTGLNYEVYNPSGMQLIFESTTGDFKVCKLAKVTSTAGTPFSMANMCIVVPNPEIYFSPDGGTNFYKFYSIDVNDPNSFYILDYTIGLTPASVTGTVYNRLFETMGSFNFVGMVAAYGSWPLFADPDVAVLQNSNFPSQYILTLDPSGANPYSYRIGMDFTTNPPLLIDIFGYFIFAGTQDTNVAGETFTFELNKFNIIEEPGIVPIMNGQTLYYVNRAGQSVWDSQTTGAGGFMMAMNKMSSENQSAGHPSDVIMAQEGISFVVQTKDGEVKQSGEIK